MDWQTAECIVPIREKPSLLWMAVGVHGPNEVKRYRFDGLWIVHLYRYTGLVTMNGVEYPIRPGYASITPPGAASVNFFPDMSRHLFAHFTLPESAGKGVPIRIMQDLGEDFIPIHQAFEEALGYSMTSLLRAEIRLWDLLWRLAEKSADRTAEALHLHPTVQKVMQIIEMRLTEPLRVSALAREVDLSHNHLTRLFHAATGKTVIGYIQERRIQRARHLLIHSTLPIKAIASEVGISNLHHFNKTIRKALGEAPRSVRARRPDF